ncbi:hypothetical protein JAAARDRAFT_28469 [Jaapia argillacea MUCL 33604]|uniref:Uncharacterized protein n=1 Tax=Jaapia argillacea MUCL 33604 TaxID=933084 RepID=A0A067QMQ7_9AGAM|nr:hypothetical protein JAAARDRAFT_28469 [Jaapia argillacea MUCL 33604]
MLSNLIRDAARRAPRLQRCMSAHASTPAKPQPRLPDKKMRALISLYHQADTFITLENLDEAIDRAFTGDDTRGIPDQPWEKAYRDLENEVWDRRSSSRVGDWQFADAGRRSWHASSWSNSRTEREGAVVDALYGLDGNRPGLEILEEEAKNAHAAAEADRKGRS